MFYVIIRGPAGSGKTTISKILAKKIKAKYISIDDILEKNKLDKIEGKCIPEENFIKSNEIAIQKINTDAVIDGCFYHKSQINHLIRNLTLKHYIFTLKIGLDECVKRDKTRKSIGGESIKAVYNLCSKFDYGVIIDASKPKNKIIKEILVHIRNK